MKRISILGSTGSIGVQTINVCKALGFTIVAISANNSVELLVRQAIELKPKLVCIYDKTKYLELKQKLNHINTVVVCGIEGLCKVAMVDCDILVNSVVGIAGLKPTVEAIKLGRTIALANKETLVSGGRLIMELVEEYNATILPVDSEHSAIFQCMQGNRNSQLKKIFLTASGGPFFGFSKEELKEVGINDALKHPNWKMGNKITIDSATLMNKGLELIEASLLFNCKPSKIEIVVHRQSVVHSMVQYDDNSIIAQLGVPDMSIPIQYALTYPERYKCDVAELSLIECGALTFEPADVDTFLCLSACIKAANMGGLYPALVNGANEQAVELFLEGKISFLNIGEFITEIIDEFTLDSKYTLDDVFEVDKLAREFVMKKVF